MSFDVLYANDRPGEYPDSYYHATASLLTPQPELEEDIACDVCVIGGGYMGLTTALHLAEAGFDVALLEAHRVGWGASGRNGGQVGSGQRVEQDDLEKQFGLGKAMSLWQIGEDSKNLVRSLISKHQIDAEYKPGIIHAELDSKDVPACHDYVDLLRERYSYENIVTLNQQQIRDHLGSEAYFGGYLDTGSGHLHPLKFALGLAKAALNAGVRVFEKTQVTELQEGDPAQVHTSRGRVSAKFVVLGCNGCLLYTSPSPRDRQKSRMPSSA